MVASALVKSGAGTGRAEAGSQHGWRGTQGVGPAERRAVFSLLPPCWDSTQTNLCMLSPRVEVQSLPAL